MPARDGKGEGEFGPRWARLRSRLRSRKLQWLLVLGRANIRYLTGFRGDPGWLLVGARKAIFLTDFRFVEQAREELFPGVELREIRHGDWLGIVKAIVTGARKPRLGVEGDQITGTGWKRLQEELGGTRVTLEMDLVADLRAVKTAKEIARIARASALASQILAGELICLSEGMSELQVAAAILCQIWERGGRAAFEPIVAFGHHSSQPHALSTRRRLRPGAIIMIDLGVGLEGYHSDLTRTYVYKKFPPGFSKYYQAVLTAQKRALETIAPGVKAADVDRAARGYLESHGWGGRFGHSLGHGVGLEIHESPRLGPRSAEVLEEGMVMTVEPGVYIPGWGGIRIEDTVVVTSRGCRVLTRSPKELSDVKIGFHS